MDSADILISMGVAAIIESVKNPTKKAALKRKILKVFNAIKVAYADDPDFA